MVMTLIGRSEAQAPARAPRLDGRPNLNGIWQVMNTANWDLQSHQARSGAIVALGAVGAVPPGLGVVVGEEIPYRPEAVAKKQANAANWVMLDPEVKCYFPGVPRATYMPHPFQIIQGSREILISYQYASAVRPIQMETHTQPPADTWMGWSNGKWEGDTLVVDVTGFNGQTWLDRAGNHHSDALHVVERYTLASPDIIQYEATLEDPKTFTRPWTIRMPLYRHIEPNAQLLEFKCVEFVEETLWGHLRKPTSR
jgi:hypothetical protein